MKRIINILLNFFKNSRSCCPRINYIEFYNSCLTYQNKLTNKNFANLAK